MVCEPITIVSWLARHTETQNRFREVAIVRIGYGRAFQTFSNTNGEQLFRTRHTPTHVRTHVHTHIWYNSPLSCDIAMYPIELCAYTSCMHRIRMTAVCACIGDGTALSDVMWMCMGSIIAFRMRFVSMYAKHCIYIFFVRGCIYSASNSAIFNILYSLFFVA